MTTTADTLVDHYLRDLESPDDQFHRVVEAHPRSPDPARGQPCGAGGDGAAAIISACEHPFRPPLERARREGAIAAREIEPRA